jgi:hypothetical protein
LSNQWVCYREAQIRPAHAEVRRLGAPLGRRWGHGMPCPDLQPETGASRATARRRRWGAVGGTACRAPTCNRKPALRAPRRGGAVGGTACRAPTCNRKQALRAPRAPRRGGAVGGTACRAPTCSRKQALRAIRQVLTIPDKPSSAPIRRIRADSCSIPTPETCTVWSGATCYNCGIQANGQCCTRRLC